MLSRGQEPVRVVSSARTGVRPVAAPIPPSGPYTYTGHRYTVFTVPAEAFPSGPLTIRALVPDPYL